MRKLNPTGPYSDAERRPLNEPARCDQRTNGYDVVRFFLQLAQVLPVIAETLHTFVTNSWALPVLTTPVAIAIWRAAVFISAQQWHTYGAKKSAEVRPGRHKARALP